jgi:AhpD family alkylhydroperoxidase
MKEIKFRNLRFNPELTPFLGLSRQMAEAFGYTANLSVDKELAQLLRLRVAQKNECAYCIILHSKAARDIGIPAEKVDNISSWWNSELYDKKVKAALGYCDILTEGSNKDFQKYHNQLENYFSEKEIAEIAAVIINMNVWTRLKLAQGETPYYQE